MVQAECTGLVPASFAAYNNDADDLADDISGTSVTPVDESAEVISGAPVTPVGSSADDISGTPVAPVGSSAAGLKVGGAILLVLAAFMPTWV
jgi:hypothetical protein